MHHFDQAIMNIVGVASELRWERIPSSSSPPRNHAEGSLKNWEHMIMGAFENYMLPEMSKETDLNSKVNRWSMRTNAIG
jgi:hypothetical protein